MSSEESGLAALKKEYDRQYLRNDELVKQDVVLYREYTTLLRKVSSLATVLGAMDPELKAVEAEEKPRLISENALKLAPGLQWYNRQIELISSLLEDDADNGSDGETGKFHMPEELRDSYALYRDTPLLYTDDQ